MTLVEEFNLLVEANKTAETLLLAPPHFAAYISFAEHVRLTQRLAVQVEALEKEFAAHFVR